MNTIFSEINNAFIKEDNNEPYYGTSVVKTFSLIKTQSSLPRHEIITLYLNRQFLKMNKVIKEFHLPEDSWDDILLELDNVVKVYNNTVMRVDITDVLDDISYYMPESDIKKSESGDPTYLYFHKTEINKTYEIKRGGRNL